MWIWPATAWTAAGPEPSRERGEVDTLPRMLRSRPLLLSLCLGSVAACAGDEVSAEGEAGESETGPDAIQLGGPAHGISIVAVEANQGTAILLTDGATPIEQGDRNAFLVSQRDTLIRFQHVIDDPAAWIPREIVGFLHVLPADGSPEIVRERRFFVEGDSDPRSLPTNFYFSLLASEAQVGTEYWIELREGDASLDVSGMGEGVAMAPAEPAAFGFETSPLELKVMLVPVDYQWPDPPRLAIPTADDVQLFHDQLLMQNPLQSIDIRVRDEPLVYDERVTNLGELLVPTSILKQQDGADANVYYHSLLDVGGSSVNMVAGIAFLANANMGDGDRRVAATVFHKIIKPADEETGDPEVVYPPTNSARTFVHEVGHNQGLSHVYCPGADSAGPDPSYPYEDGKIGVYGFGIRDYHIYTPGASHDYMSYCGNSWVSDWTWNKTYNRIFELTSWDYGGAPAQPPTQAPTQAILTGMLFADGSERWWITQGVAQTPTGAQVIELRREGQLRARVWVEQDVLSDGVTQVLSAALPPDIAPADIEEFVRVDQSGRRHAIDQPDLAVRVTGR